MSKSLTELLGPDEHVILQTRQHWWVLFVDAALQLLGMLVIAAALIFTTQRDWFDEHRVGGWIINALWVVFALLAAVFVWRLLTWLVQKFTITTTKVVYQHGLIQRDVISVPLVKLDEVTLVQPIMGRLLRFGRLDVENASGGKAPLAGLKYLPKPKTIYREITERARHQRLLEGGGHQDADGDGLVDAPQRPAAKTAVRETSTMGDSSGIVATDTVHRSPDAAQDTGIDPDGPHVVHTETTAADAATTDVSASDSGSSSDGGGGDGGGGE